MVQIDSLTSRERVSLAVARQQTDRVPLGHIGKLPIDTVSRLEIYLGVVGEDAIKDRLGFDDREIIIFTRVKDPNGSGESRSVWGGVQTMQGMGAPFSAASGPRPLRNAATAADVEAYSWPEPDQIAIEKLTPERAAYLHSFSVMCTIPPVFCTLAELMGMDVALVNLLAAPSVVEAAVARIAQIGLELEARVLDTYANVLHRVRLWDDVCGQRGMLFSPDLWRRLFRPHLAKAFALAKSYDMLIHYHCCGAMSDIIPDLIDIGMDILEPCQVHLPGMEPSRLKREYGRHIAFWGGVNTQQTLPFGTPEEIRSEVCERVRVLGRGGGYVLSPDHTFMPDVPPENIVALCDEGLRGAPIV
jgi:uroporphyrinogen decarboxylase